jgi:hypothetical protein
VKRDVLEQCGGVPDVPLMEEFKLCKILAAHGRKEIEETLTELGKPMLYDRSKE